MTPAALAARATARGVSVIGLADHLWLTKPRPGQPANTARPAPARILALRPLLAALPAGSPHILLGAEADCAPGMGIAGGDELAGFDYVVGAYHFSEIRAGWASWPRTPGELAHAMLDGFREIVMSPHVRVAGHPFFIPPRVYHRLPEALRERLGDAFGIIATAAPRLLQHAQRAGIAVELNAKALGRMHQPALLPFYRAAKDVGCRFVLSSDAHRLDDVGRSGILRDYARSAGIEDADFMDVQPRSTPPAAPG